MASQAYQLLDSDLWMSHLANNRNLDPDTFFKVKNVVYDIIQGHRIKYALTAAASVPKVYLQQFWHHMECVTINDELCLRTKIDNTKVTLSLDELRAILRLPTAAMIEGKEDFDPLVDVETICEDILSMGYHGPLSRISQFKTKGLQGLWYIIWNIITKCLTGKASGHDTGSVATLRMFHSFVFDRHFDYGRNIWDEIREFIQDKSNEKKKKKYIPFQRFFQILVRHFMETNPRSIFPRPKNPVYPIFSLGFLKPHPSQPGIVIRPLPRELLQYANPDQARVRDYIGLNYPAMAAPEPGQPTPAGRDVSEERIEGVGGEESNLRGRDIEGVEGEGVETGVAAEDEVQVQTHLRQRKKRAIRSKQAHDVPAPGPSPTEHTLSVPVPESNSPTAQLHLIDEPLQERAVEGFVADQSDFTDEMMDYLMSSPRVQQFSGSYERVVSTEGEPQPSQIRASQSQATSPVAECTPPPSHSLVSQQTSVSPSHGDIPHMPPLSHLETGGVESRRSPPRSSPSLLSTLSPSRHFTYLRTPATTHDVFVTSGTSRSVHTTSVAEMTEGIPATATQMPTVSAGHPGATPAVETGILSEPRVTRADLDALKAYQEEQFGTILRLLKGKDQATSSGPPPGQVPPASESVQVEDLVTKADLRAFRTEMVNIVSSQVEAATVSMVQLYSSLESKIHEIQSQMSAMQESMASLEQHCRPAAQGLKRRHDDPEDEGHPEGEKRQRVSSSGDAGRVGEGLISSVFGGDQGSEGLEKASEFEGQHSEDLSRALIVFQPSESSQQPSDQEIIEVFSSDSDLDEPPIPKILPILENPNETTTRANIPSIPSLTSTAQAPSATIPSSSGPRTVDVFEGGRFVRTKLKSGRVRDIFVPSEAGPSSTEPNYSEEQFIQKDAEWVDALVDGELFDEEKERWRAMTVDKAQEYLRVSPEPAEQTIQAKRKRRKKRERRSHLKKMYDENLLQPFLEHHLDFMYSKESVGEISKRWLLRLDERPKSEQIEYEVVMLRGAQPANRVKSKVRIKKIRDITCHKISKIWSPTFTVVRRNDELSIFGEEDLDNLEYDDLEWLYLRMKRANPNQTRACAILAVLRSMRRISVSMIVKDFQMAVENLSSRVGVEAPRYEFPQIHLHPIFKVLRKPEHGVVFCNIKNEKCFMRFEEIAAYSDGTLRLIRTGLHMRLEQDRLMPSPLRLPLEESNEIRRGIELIDDRLVLREYIRRFEVYLQLRQDR